MYAFLVAKAELLLMSNLLRAGECFLDYLHVCALAYGETTSHASKSMLYFEMTLLILLVFVCSFLQQNDIFLICFCCKWDFFCFNQPW